MFKRIMIAVDNGPPAARAVDVAVRLAEQVGAKVCLVHVFDPSRAFYSEIQVMDERILSKLKQDGEHILQTACDRVPKHLKVERVLLDGEPSEGILDFAREWHADLIVLGNDSRGRLAHFLLGSTADAVIRRAPCPVMTVRVDSPIDDALRTEFTASKAAGKC
jgi:nucleotide-binding universal stress UspA family protein